MKEDRQTHSRSPADIHQKDYIYIYAILYRGFHQNYQWQNFKITAVIRQIALQNFDSFNYKKKTIHFLTNDNNFCALRAGTGFYSFQGETLGN
jgi:hypothetical protein